MKDLRHLAILMVFLTLGPVMRPVYSQPADKPIYKTPSFPVEQRIDDLISRMTLEEKVGQLNMPCLYVEELGLVLRLKQRDAGNLLKE